MSAPLIPGMDNVGSFIDLSSIMYWVGYLILIVFMLAILGAVFYYVSFPIKANIFQIYGSGTDGTFAFSKRKTNRVKWNAKKTAWQPMFPLFNHRQIQPFDTEYLYPGKQIYVFELNNEWMPGRINVAKVDEDNIAIPKEEQARIEEEVLTYLRKKKSVQWIPVDISVGQTEDKIRGSINPVPYTVREWQSIEYKRNAIEYAEHNFWNDNKSLVVFLICSITIIGAGLLFVYMSYKMAGAGSQDIQSLVKALGSVGNIPGQGLPPS